MIMRVRNKMERRLNSEVDASIIDLNELKESPNTTECEAYDVMFINGFLSANETAIQCWGFHPSNPWYLLIDMNKDKDESFI